MTETDDVQNTPEARVRTLLEQGIAQVKSGEHHLGMAAFEDAGRQATDAGLTALAAGAAIDRGWALWLAGEREPAITAYEEGATLAREANDDARLAIALGNLGVAYTDSGRYAEADALYPEYLEYISDDRAEQVDVHLDWGVALEGLDRTDEAFALYWKAFDIAAEAEDAGLTGTVTMALGRAYTRHADHAKAADCFGEAARAFRHLEDDTLLGAALYQHGSALRRVGLVDEALEVWREAEPIFRELGDQRALGECLLVQALSAQGQLSNYSPDMQLTEAAAAFRAAGDLDRLPEIYLIHAQWCWDRSMDSAARKYVDEALEAAAVAPDPGVESRARTLHAQMLADANDLEGAEAELATAEDVARTASDLEGVTGVMARRAYVMARSGASYEDVRAQLFAAGDHARDAGHESQGRVAAEAIATEIEDRCGRLYTDLLGAPDEKNVVVPTFEAEMPDQE